MLIDLYVMVLLLRIWMQWSRCDFYNPLAQFVVKITQPVIKPLRRVLPAIGPIDTASLLLAFVLTTLRFHALQRDYPAIDTLSLGMSDDMEAAIAAGSTMVRIGTALFGARDYARPSQQ
ncbi:hypothetical protein CRX72_03795 [Pantoea sp. BRM17]|nr:hypothetical protein CRX72_03795 [Pantoea sp. BRM17]